MARVVMQPMHGKPLGKRSLPTDQIDGRRVASTELGLVECELQLAQVDRANGKRAAVGLVEVVASPRGIKYIFEDVRVGKLRCGPGWRNRLSGWPRRSRSPACPLPNQSHEPADGRSSKQSQQRSTSGGAAGAPSESALARVATS